MFFLSSNTAFRFVQYKPCLFTSFLCRTGPIDEQMSDDESEKTEADKDRDKKDKDKQSDKPDAEAQIEEKTTEKVTQTHELSIEPFFKVCLAFCFFVCFVLPKFAVLLYCKWLCFFFCCMRMHDMKLVLFVTFP